MNNKIKKILGYNLVVMMITIAVGSIVLVMVVNAYVGFYKSKVTTEGKSVLNDDVLSTLYRMNMDITNSGIFGCYSLRRQATLITGGMTAATRDTNIMRAAESGSVFEEGYVDYLDNGLLVLTMNSFVNYAKSNKLNYILTKFTKDSTDYSYSFASGDFSIDESTPVMRIQYGMGQAKIIDYSPTNNRATIDADTHYSTLSGSGNLTPSASIMSNAYQPYLSADAGFPPVYSSCGVLYQNKLINLSASGSKYYAQINNDDLISVYGDAESSFKLSGVATNPYVVYYVVGTKTYKGVVTKGLYAIPITSPFGTSDEPILLSQKVSKINYISMVTYKIDNDHYTKQEISQPDYILAAAAKNDFPGVIPARMMTGITMDVYFLTRDSSGKESSVVVTKHIDL